MKVLFVCLGNICRSPLAEGIFVHKMKNAGFDSNLEADSCGTSNYHIGHLPDARTIENAEKNGVELNHRGRQLVDADLQYYDYILAMDQSNYNNILRIPGAGRFKHKIMLMRAFDPHVGEEVPDPYYGSEKEFQEVFEILDRSIEGFIKHLRKDKS